MKSPNLFKVLSKYGSGAEEDYLTESFVLLIKIILEQKMIFGLLFLNKICGLTDDHKFKNRDLLSISTQVIIEGGRPDIEIKYGNKVLIYIEIKHDASLGDGQLEYYRRKLNESDFRNTVLVLLTRSQITSQETTLERSEYHHICWYNIYNWLLEIRTDNAKEICNFLVQEFLFFLEEKQMSLKQISWEYIKGVPSLVALSNLLEIAISETIPDFKLKKTGGSSWLGFNLEATYFCGVRYSDPLTIVFENNCGTNPTYKKNLDLNDVHFFSLNQAEQLECLTNFIQEANIGKDK